MRNRYYGPHLHAALTCLRAGYPENAASWMERDIGEIYGPEEYPVPSTLREADGGIEYDSVGEFWQGQAGAGI